MRVAHGGRAAGASCVTGYEWENLVRQVGSLCLGPRAAPGTEEGLLGE